MNNDSPAWQILETLSEKDKQLNLKDIFASDPLRFDKFSLKVENILFDYSKNLVTEEIMTGLFDLARNANVEGWRKAMFSGDRINITEDRPVLHVALRDKSGSAIDVDGMNIRDMVSSELAKMKKLTENIRSGNWQGYSGKAITDVVSIGIGGSNLGPQMVTEALDKYCDGRIRVHYVSNVDSFQINQILRPLNPEQVLFIVSSKTFTTRETLTNAATAREWLLASSRDESTVKKHFIAATSNGKEALKFGIPAKNCLDLWDWVGGRFSLWSAIGLPIALNLGFDNFEKLLGGAYAMDQHFLTAPLERNAPVIQALIGIWNRNFLGLQSMAILPYNQSLHMFPAYIQQADMESNGKSVDRDGNEVPYATGPVIWGQLGINGQHAFFQLLHQGKNIIPADFIAAVESPSGFAGHDEYLMANFIAQTQALMNGIDQDQVRANLRARGKSDGHIEKLVSHKVHEGNRPSNSILLESIDPHSLGALIALYEHKIFVQGIIWRICSFDQWGVELGKEMADHILPQLEENGEAGNQDSSTKGLLDFYKKVRQRPKS